MADDGGDSTDHTGVHRQQSQVISRRAFGDHPSGRGAPPQACPESRQARTIYPKLAGILALVRRLGWSAVTH